MSLMPHFDVTSPMCTLNRFVRSSDGCRKSCHDGGSHVLRIKILVSIGRCRLSSKFATAYCTRYLYAHPRPRISWASMRQRLMHVLPLVSDCGAHDNAALTPVSFTSLSETTQIIALASVSSVCGPFRFGTASPRWAIGDHGIELARPIFDVGDD
ncbi:uncharacterized protein EI90DRAFT_2688991 [Cantharellus anzutake]|uniref:uncharacterized protein n=1 Tax=Cantharellus anzutake TaxID=1750568 RepID=UPI0019034236|nr:uncharacterized protein EI90DRAFT_2688991 [Cantharellus anzutake]KAF8318909.1 hypothetical protein EI90DRAFT_2688991 [Cantharellus anzutake]